MPALSAAAEFPVLPEKVTRGNGGKTIKSSATEGGPVSWGQLGGKVQSGQTSLQCQVQQAIDLPHFRGKTSLQAGSDTVGQVPAV